METLSALIKRGEVAVVEEVPGLVWRIEKPANKPKYSIQYDDEKKFVCWTCGKEFEAADFLWHIRECCKT